MFGLIMCLNEIANFHVYVFDKLFIIDIRRTLYLNPD